MRDYGIKISRNQNMQIPKVTEQVPRHPPTPWWAPRRWNSLNALMLATSMSKLRCGILRLTEGHVRPVEFGASKKPQLSTHCRPVSRSPAATPLTP